MLSESATSASATPTKNFRTLVQNLHTPDLAVGPNLSGHRGKVKCIWVTN